MVYHVLSNGVTTKDITGHIVKLKDAEPVYELMRSLSVKSRRQNVKRK